MPQGPNVSSGDTFVVQSADAPPNGSVAGALDAVVPSPTDANTLYVASPNGGIWKTTNGGATWTALTNTQANLSVASLALDPTDPTARTLIAGTGLSSNGTVCGNSPTCFFAGSGNAPTGLLITRDGGTTWTALGAATFAGQSVDAVAERGQIIVAGTFETGFSAPAAQRMVGGLYRSTDGGATFNLVSGGSGLPAGPVSSIVGDPANTNRLYAAVTAPNATAGGFASTAVYVSNDAGASWAPVFNVANSGGTINGTAQTAIRMAAGPNGTLAVGVFTMPNGGAPGTGSLTGLFYSSNSGATWTALTVPTINNGGQSTPNFAIAIDPNNPRFVYVSGDRIAASPFTVTAFRIDAVANTVTSLTDAGFTANGSSVHADSRALAFDANGRLLLVGDGGVYARSQPQNTTGTWVSLNNLSVREIGSIGYDAVSKRLAVAAQDTGAAIQNAPNATQYTAVNGGDGTMVAINDRTIAGNGVFYTASQNLSGLNRFVFDAQGNPVGPANGAQVTCNGGNCGAIPGLVFSAPFVLNKVDPSRIAIGGDQVYITQDLTGANGPAAATVNLNLTGLTAFGGSVVKIAYGTNDNPNAILAADAGGTLALSTTATAGSFNVLGAYTGGVPTALVFDNRTQNRFYTTDFTNVFGTRDRGNTFQNLTANLPANFANPTALEFISNNGVNALLVGGVNTIANAPSTVVAADSDGSGNLSGWRFFGQGLPNVQVNQLVYNPQVDVLAVGTFGRGAFTMYDVTSNFAQATVLQFGLANNDSNPSAAILTNGTSANRPLIKYGTGTLTITGNASYTGGTTINNGVLQLGNGGNSGAILGNVTFCSNAADPLCSAAANSKTFAFNRSDVSTFAGVIAGPGQVAQTGPGTTILTGTSTYTGQTFVNAGVLQVDGRLTSQVVVNPGGMLAGTGTTGGTIVGTGAMIAPGNVANAPPIGTLRDAGALTMQPGSAVRIEVAQTADELAVGGSASIAGATLMLVFDPTPLAKHSVLLTAAGGLGGTTFSTTSFTNLPAGITAVVSYQANEVDLDLTAQLGAGQSLTRNGNALSGAINSIFNSGGVLPPGVEAIFGVTGGALSSGLASLSGEVHASTASVLVEESLFMRSAILGRLRQASYGDGSGPMAALRIGGPLAFAGDDEISSAFAFAQSPIATKAPPGPRVAQPDTVFWAQGFDAWGRSNGAGNAAGVNRNLAGFISGVDTRVGSSGRAGFAAGYSGSQNTLDVIGSANVDTAHLAVYGGSNLGPLNLRGGADYAFHSISTDRAVAFPGFLDPASSSYTGSTGQVFGEVGRGFTLAKLALEPFAGAAFVSAHTGAGFERAAAAGLNFSSTSFDVGYSTLGLRAASLMLLQNGMVLIPHASVAWQHTFGGLTPTNILAFQTAPTVPFAISGVPIARDAALNEVGLDAVLNAHATIGLAYSGQLASTVVDHAVKGKFNWKF